MAQDFRILEREDEGAEINIGPRQRTIDLRTEATCSDTVTHTFIENLILDLMRCDSRLRRRIRLIGSDGRFHRALIDQIRH